MEQTIKIKAAGWLLFFYSVPAKPVNARVKIWRKLAKSGAVLFKGSVYVLPNNEDNLELCQWLVSEVEAMKGEAAFVSADRIDTMKEADVIDLFNRQRERDYAVIEKELDDIERRISSIKKGTGTRDNKKLSEQADKCRKGFEDVRKIDFFASKRGTVLEKKSEALQREIQGLSKSGAKKPTEIISRNIEDYQGRTWVTRNRPFVDRMASAWLIRRFIDRKAVFSFIEEKKAQGNTKSAVLFDLRDGEFTHIGDMCTFEVLIKSFGLKDKALKEIAAAVHELDIKDQKYKNTEVKGIEDILTGIRKTAKTDMEILEKGMTVFEMLYASRT